MENQNVLLNRLTPGQVDDITQAEALVSGLPAEIPIADQSLRLRTLHSVLKRARPPRRDRLEPLLRPGFHVHDPRRLHDGLARIPLHRP